MAYKTKRTFSLIELLIVIGLIAFAFGGGGMAIHRLIKKERFTSSISLLKTKLKLAQEIAADYNTDVTMTLAKQEKGVTCFLTVPSSVPKRLRQAMNRSQHLPGMKQITLNHQEKTKLLLTVYSSGSMTPKEEIKLHGNANFAFCLGEYFLSLNNGGEHAPYPKKVEETLLSSA